MKNILATTAGILSLATLCRAVGPHDRPPHWEQQTWNDYNSLTPFPWANSINNNHPVDSIVLPTIYAPPTTSYDHDQNQHHHPTQAFGVPDISELMISGVSDGSHSLDLEQGQTSSFDYHPGLLEDQSHYYYPEEPTQSSSFPLHFPSTLQYQPAQQYEPQQVPHRHQHSQHPQIHLSGSGNARLSASMQPPAPMFRLDASAERGNVRLVADPVSMYWEESGPSRKRRGRPRKDVGISIEEPEKQVVQVDDVPDYDSDDEFFQSVGGTTNDMRQAIGLLWIRKGLWVGMDPRELAAGVAEIKVEMGIDAYRSAGLIASRHIRNHPRVTKTYADEYADWTSKFTRRVMNLNIKFVKMEPEEKKRRVLASVHFLQFRREYVDHVTATPNEDKINEGKLDREAKQVWTSLQAIAAPYLGQYLEHASLEDLENVSRIAVAPYPMAETADLVKRYLLRQLNRTPSDVDIFSQARNQWLKGIHLAQLGIRQQQQQQQYQPQ